MNCSKKIGHNLALASLLVAGLGLSALVFAAATSTFNQTINPGTLSVDIVDGSYVSVSSPSITMGATTVNFACQTVTGTFGTATQQIYVKNPDASDTGWVLSLAGSAPTALWHSAANGDYDFNDPTTAGCTDGADADSVGGQMTVDASAATLAQGACLTCNVTGITKGTSSAFNQGSVDSITLLNAAAASSDIGDWKLTTVNISQKIPAEAAAASYSIGLTLSVVAQ